jgi:hypothetical protein
MKPAKRRWLAASESVKAKAIEIAGGEDLLALLIAKDLLEDSGRGIPPALEAEIRDCSSRTVRRDNKKNVK